MSRLLKHLFVYEAKRLLIPRTAVIIVALLLVSLVGTSIGISRYKQTLAKKETFREIEKVKISKYRNYQDYGAKGFRLLFTGSPMSVFFYDSAAVPDLNANINFAGNLDMFLPLKDVNPLSFRKTMFADFSGMMLFFGSLLALLYGFNAFRHTGYLKFLGSLRHPAAIFAGLTTVRLILLITLFTLMLAASLAFIGLSGLPVPLDGNLAAFWLLVAFVILFFFAMGSLFGNITSLTAGISAMLSCWFLFIFIIPATVNSITEQQSTDLNTFYQFELQKERKIKAFEKEAANFSMPQLEDDSVRKKAKREITQTFLKDLANIHQMEKKRLDGMRQGMVFREKIACLFPSTLYQHAANELSSRGYSDFLDFYRHAGAQQQEFTRYILLHAFIRKHVRRVNVFRGTDNVYKGTGKLTPYFFHGLGLTLFYSLILLAGAYLLLWRRLYPQPKEACTSESIPVINLFKGSLSVFSETRDMFSSRMYKLFSGVDGKKSDAPSASPEDQQDVEVLVEGEGFLGCGKRRDFFYLCSLSEFPWNITVGELLRLAAALSDIEPVDADAELAYFKAETAGKRLDRISADERSRTELALLDLVKRDYYLLKYLAGDMSARYIMDFRDRLFEMADNDASIILVTPDNVFDYSFSKEGDAFIHNKLWVHSAANLEDLAPLGVVKSPQVVLEKYELQENVE